MWFLLALACATDPLPAVDPHPVAAPPTSEFTVLTPTPSPLEADESALSFEAILRVDAEPSYKHFQGVWLERDDGERWLIDYRALGCWTPFDGHRVSATGERYEPEGQSIGAPHFRVKTLSAVDPMAMSALVQVGPERTLTGRLSTASGAPGSKQEGSSWTVFVADSGGSWSLLNPSAVQDLQGETISVKGRAVERSPFYAHAGGPLLFVISAR